MATHKRDNLRPEVQALLDAMAAGRAARVLEANAQRAFDTMTATAFGLGAPAVAVEREIAIPGPGGEMRAIVYAPDAPSGEPRPVVLYMHGGGFVIMLPETSARICKQIAAGAGAVVVNIEYRRAPEHPYPAPLDDCVAAFRWLRANAASLGGDPSRIAAAGESAGGNLAAALALRLIADGEKPPSGVGLLCPWLDLGMTTPSSRELGPDDPVLDDAVLDYWRRCYAPEGSWAEPLVSPMYAALSGFPPACVVVGGIDPLCDEGLRFAAALRAAGGDAEVQEYEGMPHVFMLFPQTAPLTDYAEKLNGFLRRVL